jgi:uncharacterized membrane protein
VAGNRHVTVYLLALLLGVLTGLRTMAAPTTISVAARMGRLPLSDTPFALLGSAWMPWLLMLMAIGELIADQLPSTPSRTVPVAFGLRIGAGMLSGAAVGAAYGSMAGGLIAGAAGAVIGTLGGHAARARLARAFGRDRPAALIEDAVTYVGAAILVIVLP